MKEQACAPCAKRKVRCDKEEPCSNCKRRKQDHCVYPEAAPIDKIRKLESLVRDLGGDPEEDIQRARKASRSNRDKSSPSTALQPRSQQRSEPSRDLNENRGVDAVILEEDGQPFYLESRAWHGWLGNAQDPGTTRPTGTKNPFRTVDYPDALQSIICRHNTLDLTTRFPHAQTAVLLWTCFTQRVDPLSRISFQWQMESFKTRVVHHEHQRSLNNAEIALTFSIYLIGAVSLSEEECQRDLGQRKLMLVSEMQGLCEEALSRTNIFCVKEMMVLEALTFYIMAGADRLSTHSLSSLMGLVIRNAEKLGIHRDGSLLGLAALETERRRRLWWQLQHLDLGLALRSGMTSLTLMSNWDVKLPLNIEDTDINVTMKEPPKERKGLTSISYCLFAYFVLNLQRSFFNSATRGQVGISWQADRSLPFSELEARTDQMEEGLNKKFLQYCDPIKPLDTLIQLSARALICGTRLRNLHPFVYEVPPEDVNEEHRDELFTACIQCLEYNITLHALPSLKHFQWWTKNFFPWQSFMCVLIEGSRQEDPAVVQKIWDTLSDLYSKNEFLSILAEDRRRPHAARLVVSAWKARQKKSNAQDIPLTKPAFVSNLERRLSEFYKENLQITSEMSGTHIQQQPQMQPQQQQYQPPILQNYQENITNFGLPPITPESLLAEQDGELTFSPEMFDIDIQDIDWSFWSNMA